MTQNPLDVPEGVLAQMGNRVQHALRAYTPREQKAVQVAASTFRPNPKFKTEKIITELGKGEALVSVLDPKGVPTIVEHTFICPPTSRLGPITDVERAKLVKGSPVYGTYEQTIDRESAYEKLSGKAKARAAAQQVEVQAKADAKIAKTQTSAARREPESATDKFVKGVAGTVGRQLGATIARSIGNALVRGILGGLTRR